MLRPIICSVLFFAFSLATSAQTREDLENQRKQLKREIEETQKLLNSNKAETKQNLTTLSLLSNKVKLQDRVIQNIDKDLHILDNNIYTIQRDLNRYDRQLDTLKAEYAKSMVYAYKNRGNYEFLNFIFSADNFNEAVKRIAYLKSYRSYRELQGENIIRTQEMRKQRLQDLGMSKKTKSSTLEVQSKEKATLDEQRAEQDRVVLILKKEGKDLNARIGAKQKQMAKVNAAVKSAIAAAIKAEAKKKADDKLAADKARRDAAALMAKSNVPAGTGKAVEAVKPRVKDKSVSEPSYETLNKENLALSANFKSNQGSLPWPVEFGKVTMHYGSNVMSSGSTIQSSAITIVTPIGSSVKSVFDGVVMLVQEIDEGKEAVTIKHGEYYTTYSNLTGVSVKKDQEVKTGHMIGRVASNLDGLGSIDFYSAKGFTDLDPERWLRRR